MVKLAIIFIFCIGLSVYFAQIPIAALLFYLLMSLATFIVYAIDKSAARKGTWRTQENTLHILALVGGWPGAMIAQQTLRHKTRKQPFRVIFWITVMINCVLLGCLFTQSGSAMLASTLASIS
jgi:uncharacterized membrane protein YsdA (DUF1294 family)